MSIQKSETKLRPRPGKDVRLSAQLAAHINFVLQERYVENRSVSEVLSRLSGHGVTTSRGRLQEFIRRTLCLVRPDQARRLGAEAEMLRAIRCRLKLPLIPRAGKIVAPKPRQRFDSRQRRRRIVVGPKAKRPTPTCPSQAKAPSPGQMLPSDPFAFVASTPTEIAEFQRFNRAQLRQVNEVAMATVRAKSMNVYTNVEGRCFDIKTKKNYTPEDLQAEFGLTYAEAQSLFLTVDHP